MTRCFYCAMCVGLAVRFAGTGYAGTIGFSNQTDQAGLSSFTGCHGWVLGGAVGDLNRDGYQDIVYCGSTFQILINNGDGTFSDQTANWGIPVDWVAYSASVADYDGDGWLDVYVSSPGYSQGSYDRLLRNNGDSSFTEVTVDAGIQTSLPPASEDRVSSWGSAWGDYDLDGDLDLAICHFNRFTPNTNALFRNNGDGTLTNVTESAGLFTANHAYILTNGFTIRFVDMNDDRYPELVWIGDSRSSKYFINNADGTFTDYTDSSGINQGYSEMGMAVGDYNLDGLFDLYVTLIGYGNMYLNQSGNFFVRPRYDTSEHPLVWGWGAVSVDFDHDSRIDIITTSQCSVRCGQTALRNESTSDQLYFADVTDEAHIDNGEDGRGLANFDYDNDGDQDILVFNCGGPLTLYRNDLTGPDTHWLRVFLDTNGADGIAPDGIGSVVKIRLGDVWRINRIDGGSNYLSQSEMSAHFGLGAATMVDELRVEWTNGGVTTLTDVAADQTMTIAACPPFCSPSHPGDMNCDQRVDGRDVSGFVMAMLSPSDYASAFPDCDSENADLNNNLQIDVQDAVEFVHLLMNGATGASVAGDMNCDGAVDARDIDAFVVALTRPSDYAANYAGCDSANGDFDGDASLSLADIPGFVQALMQE